MKGINVILLFLFLASCKVTETSVGGVYFLKDSPKTALKIYPDKTFTFEEIFKNPYLHPFDHPEVSCFITKGIWKMSDNILTLQSTKDKILYERVAIEKSPVDSNGESIFTFYDLYHDTVKILYVKTNNGILSMLHASMPYDVFNLKEEDSLEFHFFGYDPWVFRNEDKRNANYKVFLRPEYKADYFQQTKLTVKRKKIISKHRGTVFLKFFQLSPEAKTAKLF